MKILFLASGNVASNFSYRVMALARGLQKLGDETAVIAPKADKYNNFIAETVTETEGVKILQPFQLTTRKQEVDLLPYLFGATTMVLHNKSNLIYIYKPSPITIVGLVAKSFRGTPIILDMDDLGSEVMKIEGHPWHRWILVGWCEHLAARYADRIVVTSTYLYKKYHRQFPKKPIHTMPNGVEMDWLMPLVSSESKKRIIFFGAINRKSILAPLFQALPAILRQHPDTQVVVIGDGRYLQHFKKICQAADIEKNIHFTGWLALNDARALLCAGDIGYCYMPDSPTVQASSNMKVPQYMARGVVPIVSDVGDLPAMVDFGNAGYIAKADDARSLETILLAALNDDERTQKAARARKIAEEKMNWNTLARSFKQWNAHYS
jgi:glycosyltransferase involved in cell wall biosynthesis